MKIIRLVSLFAGATLLAGCVGSDVNRVNQVEPTGSPFTQELARQYRDLANFEANLMADWRDADHFARKGLAAAAGEAVAPDAVEDRALPEGSVAELTAARQLLAEFFATGAIDTDPVRAATAQAKFDCWLEQQEENFQVDHIAACRDEFYAVVAVPPPSGEPVYFVFFDFDQSVITAAGQAIIDQVVADFAAGGVTSVEVVGHADRSGPDAYNLGLSQRRADAVRNALTAGGIPAAAITTGFRGEREPLVPTPDGVREPSNRRAEIRFL